MICKVCLIDKEEGVENFQKLQGKYFLKTCRICAKAKCKLRREKLKVEGKCVSCAKTATKGVLCFSCYDSAKKWKVENPEKDSTFARIRHQNIKIDLFNSYGGCKCSCPGGCEITALEFLSIDHIGGGGKQHVDNTGRRLTGVALYRWLREHNHPEGFRVLCMNCNFAIGHHGYCPHEKEREVVEENKLDLSI